MTLPNSGWSRMLLALFIGALSGWAASHFGLSIGVLTGLATTAGVFVALGWAKV